MGYLDQDGLTYLWQKIKTALAGKQDAITLGDGLSKDGDTLSVDNPVRGIMTQAEFDALTEEQKASGTYFVDDGQGGGGSSSEVYSTEEQKIGTWIDGKPLYRRIIKTKCPTGSDQFIDVAQIDDIDTVAFLFGLAVDINTNNYSAIPNPQVYLCMSKNNNPCIYLTNSNGSFFGADTIIRIEYTKTTDQGVSV